MKKLVFSLFLSFLLILCSLPFSASAESSTVGTPAFELTGQAVCLYNLDTDQIIYEKNADKQMDMTGLSQIMTALVSLERTEDPDGETVKARSKLYDRLYGKGYPTADVRQGEILSVRELLYCLMVQNSYEAAEILGDYISEGSEAYFAEMMNRKAEELGMMNTNFTNASGREETGQYSTARDMLQLIKAAMENPTLAEMATTLYHVIPANNVHAEPRTLVASNRLINPASSYYYDGATGLKVVGTLVTGRCGLFTATRNGLTYYLVVLGSPALDEDGNYIEENGALTDAKKLFSWAFSNYSYKSLVNVDSPCAQVKVTLSSESDYLLLYPKEDVAKLVPNEVDETSIYLRPVLPESVQAPIQPGQEIGYVELLLSGEVIDSVPLVAKDSVSRNQILYLMHLAKSIFLSPWAFLVYGLIVLLIVLYIIFAIYHNVQKKKHPTINRQSIHADRNSIAIKHKSRFRKRRK